VEEKERKLVVGLGNPGPKYQNTRHNAGFMALALFAEKQGLENPSVSGQSLLSFGKVAGQKVVLAWPQAFMNNSGPPTRKVLDYYKINPSNMLVVHDEMDVPLGRLKFSRGGGSAGHRGLESLLEVIPAEFDRLRFGVGRPPKTAILAKTMDYVLAPFNSLEIELLDKTLIWAADLIRVWVTMGLAKAQMLGNRAEPAQPKKPKPKPDSQASPATAGSDQTLAPPQEPTLEP
jgi:PTH1 family peptidyl-tRNA hydrolase